MAEKTAADLDPLGNSGYVTKNPESGVNKLQSWMMKTLAKKYGQSKTKCSLTFLDL